MTHTHEAHGDDAVRWSAEFWDERYASKPSLWSGRPNAAMVEEVTPLTPGRALDVGCGEGGDAIWLARQGWEVTGADVSQVALDRAAGEAAREGLTERTRWERRDLMTWAPTPASYDLVTVGFFQLPGADRRRVYPVLAEAVAVGGTFLVIAHDFSDVAVVPRPPEPDLFFTAADLLPDLPGGATAWQVHVATSRARTQTHPGTGEPVTVHDAVLRAERMARER